MSYCLTQLLSGHDCFPSYLHRFEKLQSPKCWYCNHDTNDTYHTVFCCDNWHRSRTRVEMEIGESLTLANMIQHMLQSKRKWMTIDEYIQEVMISKENEERR